MCLENPRDFLSCILDKMHYSIDAHNSWCYEHSCIMLIIEFWPCMCLLGYPDSYMLYIVYAEKYLLYFFQLQAYSKVVRYGAKTHYFLQNYFSCGLQSLIIYYTACFCFNRRHTGNGLSCVFFFLPVALIKNPRSKKDLKKNTQHISKMAIATFSAFSLNSLTL